MLASYTWGEDAQRWGSLSPEDRIVQALEDVARIHPQAADEFEVGASKMWHDDEFAGGAFALFDPGQQTLLHEAIVAPEGRIHFAGEHASLAHAWIQGAIESGLRAAAEIHEQASPPARLARAPARRSRHGGRRAGGARPGPSDGSWFLRADHVVERRDGIRGATDNDHRHGAAHEVVVPVVNAAGWNDRSNEAEVRDHVQHAHLHQERARRTRTPHLLDRRSCECVRARRGTHRTGARGCRAGSGEMSMSAVTSAEPCRTAAMPPMST